MRKTYSSSSELGCESWKTSTFTSMINVSTSKTFVHSPPQKVESVNGRKHGKFWLICMRDCKRPFRPIKWITVESDLTLPMCASFWWNFLGNNQILSRMKQSSSLSHPSTNFKFKSAWLFMRIHKSALSSEFQFIFSMFPVEKEQRTFCTFQSLRVWSFRSASNIQCPFVIHFDEFIAKFQTFFESLKLFWHEKCHSRENFYETNINFVEKVERNFSILT